MAENVAETIENILNELIRLYDIEKAYNLLMKVLEKTSERSDQPEVLGGIRSIARNHPAGLVVTVSFKTSEDAAAFEQYALSVANKKSPGQSDQILAIAEALRKHGLTLVKTAAGYDVVHLGEIVAQSQKKSPGQTEQTQRYGAAALAPPGYFKSEQPQQEPVAGKGKELSEQLKLCARNVAFAASGRVDMSSAAMQEMFALIDHVCVGFDSPSPPARKPLTREQVKDLLFEAGYVGAEESADFINGLRHGETAHGIKENK